MDRTSSRGRPKGSRGGGRGKGKRGRKPKVVVSDEEVETNQQEEVEEVATNKTAPAIDNANEKADAAEAVVVVADEPMETVETDDVSNLDIDPPSSFTTSLQRNVPQIMLRLNWNHKVNLFSEKVLNPMIYCCDQCGKPILVYGRMIPCKHVFCFVCARTEAIAKQCPRCKEKVNRVEQTALGTVFMCTFDGERYGKTGCRRTYLSQRDLQAHINHRHVVTPTTPNNHIQDIKMTDKTNNSSSAMAQAAGQQQSNNSHLRKDSMVISPAASKQTQFAANSNSTSVFSSSSQQQRMNDNSQQQSSSPMNNTSSSSTGGGKFSSSSHHSGQDSHGGYYNNQYGSHSQFNNGSSAPGGASSSNNQNNFYQSTYNNLGHYSQAPQHQQNWNQQQYYR